MKSLPAFSRNSGERGLIGFDMVWTKKIQKRTKSLPSTVDAAATTKTPGLQKAIMNFQLRVFQGGFAYLEVIASVSQNLVSRWTIHSLECSSTILAWDWCSRLILIDIYRKLLSMEERRDLASCFDLEICCDRSRLRPFGSHSLWVQCSLQVSAEKWIIWNTGFPGEEKKKTGGWREWRFATRRRWDASRERRRGLWDHFLRQ